MVVVVVVGTVVVVGGWVVVVEEVGIGLVSVAIMGDKNAMNRMIKNRTKRIRLFFNLINFLSKILVYGFKVRA